MSDSLDQGRSCVQNTAWPEAYAQLSAADGESPLEPEDLERLATAAYLSGRDGPSVDAWVRAHQGWLRQDEPARAARCAIWLGITLLLRGDEARGAGWLARAGRLLEDGPLNCVEQGYLLVPVGLQNFATSERGDHRRSEPAMTLDLPVVAGVLSTALFALGTLPMLVKAATTKDLSSYSFGNIA